MIYLVTLDVTHADPEYRAFHDLGDALNYARDQSDKATDIYKTGPDVTVCDGEYGCWFSEQSLCGSWSVTVKEVSLW